MADDITWVTFDNAVTIQGGWVNLYVSFLPDRRPNNKKIYANFQNLFFGEG